MRVLVESPFAFTHTDPALRRLGVLRNTTYARLACHDCCLRGEAAYASHLLYTQPYILDDDVPEERSFGIDAGLLWGSAASLSAFYMDLGVSRGMEYGRVNAGKAGRHCEERRLPGWEFANQETPSETLVRLGLYSEASLETIASLPVEVWEPRKMPIGSPMLSVTR
jgi:hypothetical protein